PLNVAPTPGAEVPYVTLFASDGGSVLFSSFIAPSAAGMPRIAAAGANAIVAAMDSLDGTLATSNAYQDFIAGGIDAFVMRIDVAGAPPNQPPTVSIFSPTTVTADSQGGLVQLFASAADPDGDPLTYAWSGPFLNNPTTTTPFLTALLPVGSQTVT